MAESETPLLPAKGKTSGKVLLESNPAPADRISRPRQIKRGRSLEDHLLVESGKTPKNDSQTADELNKNGFIDGEFTESDDTQTGEPSGINIPEAIVIGEVVAEAGEAVFKKVTEDGDKDENQGPEPEPKQESGEDKKEEEQKEKKNTWEDIEKKLSKIADKKINSRDGVIAPRVQDEADTLKDERDEVWEAHKNDTRYKSWKADISNEIGLIVKDDLEYRQRNILMPNSVDRNDPLSEMLNWIDLKINRVTIDTVEEQIATSWWKGVRRNIEEQSLKSEQELRDELEMPKAKQLDAAVRKLDIKIDFLNWGSNKDETRAVWEKLGDARKAWLMEEEPSYGQKLFDLRNQAAKPGDGQADMLKGLFGSGHTLESYEKTGDTRGIFNDEPGHGLYNVIPNPIVSKKAETAMESSGTWDMFIELNKFAQGRGNEALWKSLLEYALPGEDKDGERWGLTELAKFLSAIYNISKSADYKKIVGEKGLLTGIDPRAIAIIIGQVPEMESVFKHYWEKFRDPKLINKTQDAFSEITLRQDDIKIAKDLGCCEGIARATRHWVTEFGVFPFSFTETRKMVNRYPELFGNYKDEHGNDIKDEKGKEVRGPINPGIGFSIVEIQGSRSKLGPLLDSGNFSEFLKIYSDTSAYGNTDPLWSVKMWGSVDVIHDMIANIHKNALKQMVDWRGLTGYFIDTMGITPPEISYLINQGVISGKPYKLPQISEMTGTVKGSRALKPNEIDGVLKYLFNLKSVEAASPDGRIVSKSSHPILGMFDNSERGIVEALRSSLVRKNDGLDGSVL